MKKNKNKIIDFSRNNKYYIFFAIAVVFVISSVSSYLKSASIATNINKVNTEIFKLRSEVADLESKYFDLSHNISKDRALLIGLSDKKGEVKYIKVDSLGTISFADQR